MWFISLRDLQFRQRRFVIAIVGTALVFGMSLVASGMSAGFRAEVRRTVESVGATTWVIAEGTTGPFTSLALVSPGVAEGISSAGVDAHPMIVARQAVRTADGEPLDTQLIGYVRGGVTKPPVEEGRRPRRSGEAVIDARSGLHVGDGFTLGGAEFTVVGLTEGRTVLGGSPAAYVSLRDAQQALFHGAETATAVVTKGTPAEVPVGTQVITADEAASDLLRPMEKAVQAVDMLRYLLWLVAASIVGAIVYLSSLERIRDFAVLRAVGSSPAELYAGLATQAIIVSVGAAVISAGLSLGIARLFPIPVEIPFVALLLLPVVAVAVGLFASLTGLRRATAVDPALAFGGP